MTRLPRPTAGRVVLGVALLLAAILTIDLNLFAGVAGARNVAPHHVSGGFRNLSPTYSYSFAARAKGFFFKRRPPRPVRGLATVSNDGGDVRSNGHAPTVTWIGHSTFLVQIAGVNLVTDPHWGEMASPVRFAGPRRLVPPGIRFEDLPQIDAVLISHDHYDHLDESTVRRLAREHRPRFFVPLGIGQWLRERGIDDVVELDWWQQARFSDLTVVSTPAQHSSGRGVNDQYRRLWSSWVVKSRTRHVFFAGDTGYWSGMKEIATLGPFDLALIPIGGYSDYRTDHPNHVNPEEAVQLFEDVGGKLLVPMHWGTFDLNREPMHEPPSRLLAEALRRGIEERMAILSPGQTIHW
ncbi:MAG: MBL fold metallo-hydrolase [Candidatus Rokubacteria bacterium]|nr:MBL fold metallo-hydrolase [Candidatus Rokubacteria bacterium]